MSEVAQILVTRPRAILRAGARSACWSGAVAVLLAAAGCGQKGPLVIPTGPLAAQRATLPQTLHLPGSRRAADSAARASTLGGASSTATVPSPAAVVTPSERPLLDIVPETSLPGVSDPLADPITVP